MGLSVGGLAFARTPSTPAEGEMVRRAFGPQYLAVREACDIRLVGNIAVESRDESVFVYGSELVDRFLFNGEAMGHAALAGLGSPRKLLVFCHYDSGDSYGYAIFKDGVRTRARLHSLDQTSEQGIPTEPEHAWLHAELMPQGDDEPATYRNAETGETATAANVTSGMLRVVIKSLFGTCPWDEWDYKSRINYYRIETQAKTTLV